MRCRLRRWHRTPEDLAADAHVLHAPQHIEMVHPAVPHQAHPHCAGPAGPAVLAVHAVHAVHAVPAVPGGPAGPAVLAVHAVPAVPGGPDGPAVLAVLAVRAVPPVPPVPAVPEGGVALEQEQVAQLHGQAGLHAVLCHALLGCPVHHHLLQRHLLQRHLLQHGLKQAVHEVRTAAAAAGRGAPADQKSAPPVQRRALQLDSPHVAVQKHLGQPYCGGKQSLHPCLALLCSLHLQNGTAQE